MQLSSKKIKTQDLEKELTSLARQHAIDLVVGSMQVTSGVFLLLFSHRMNREISLVVTGSHERQELVTRAQKILGIVR